MVDGKNEMWSLWGNSMLWDERGMHIMKKEGELHI